MRAVSAGRWGRLVGVGECGSKSTGWDATGSLTIPPISKSFGSFGFKWPLPASKEGFTCGMSHEVRHVASSHNLRHVILNITPRDPRQAVMSPCYHVPCPKPVLTPSDPHRWHTICDTHAKRYPPTPSGPTLPAAGLGQGQGLALALAWKVGFTPGVGVEG